MGHERETQAETDLKYKQMKLLLSLRKLFAIGLVIYITSLKNLRCQKGKLTMDMYIDHTVITNTKTSDELRLGLTEKLWDRLR